MDNFETIKPDSFELLKQDCLNCSACSLCATRHNVVISAGNEKSRIMFIGEGPGENEDLQGEPFVGRAGQLLDIMLELIGLDRSSVYICNIIKCRPPGNRDPSNEERKACLPFVNRQIALVKPEIVVCLGRISACELIDSEFKITRDHGKWFKLDGMKFIASYHPSALLRDESKRPDAFSDFRKIRAELNSTL